jgi:hypothetical protein
MIPNAALCKDQGDNELRNLDTAAYTPAYTEILNGRGESLKRIVQCWSLVPEHVQQTVLLLIESAVSPVEMGACHE